MIAGSAWRRQLESMLTGWALLFFQDGPPEVVFIDNAKTDPVPRTGVVTAIHIYSRGGVWLCSHEFLEAGGCKVVHGNEVTLAVQLGLV